MKPNRSRSGPGSRPARVVAPTRVNGGISSGIAVAPGPLADDDVDPEVLHRHVEHLLGRPRHPVDLVDEEDVAVVEARQDRGEVTGVGDRRAAREPQRRAHLRGDDHRERGLAEPGRAGEQHVVGRPAPAAGRLEDQPQLVAYARLPDDLVERLGPQRRLDRAVVAVGLGVGQPLQVAQLGLGQLDVVGVLVGVVPVHRRPAPSRLAQRAEGGAQQGADVGGVAGLGGDGLDRLLRLLGRPAQPDEALLHLVAPRRRWRVRLPRPGGARRPAGRCGP